MFRADFACAVGLPWGHIGMAPWAAQFAAMVRGHAQSAATHAAATSSTFGPGDVVKLVLSRLGYRPHANCGCDEFRQTMNAWGWRGCFRRRAQVVQWFAEKAREQGIAVDDANLWSLVRAGLKDLIRRRRGAV